jgi:PKD repeat protein
VETKVDYITVDAALSIVCSAPAADAYIRSNYVTNNYGTRSDLRVKDAANDIRTYLKFDVQGGTGLVARATLKLYVNDGSDDGGTAYAVSDSSWTEGGITWNNAPAMGAAAGSAGQVNTGEWVEVDVTAAVSGNGLVSIGMMDGSGDVAVYSSREGANAPELCVEFQDGPLPLPAAEFTAAPLSGAAPLQVEFTDGSSGIPSTWAWDFGDGGSSTEQNPSHTYNTPGVYTVSLTVSNSTGADVETKVDYITVDAAPQELNFGPTADSYVRSNYPRSNYGSTADLRIKDAAADFYGYLKFDVQGVTGSIQRATLRLYVLDASNDGGTAFAVSDSSWTEGGITWNNAPSMGAALGSAGAVNNGKWIEIDVTGAVSGNGLVSIGLKSGSKDLVKYSSKEGSNPPLLVVEY